MKHFYQSMGVARRSTTRLYAQTLHETLDRAAASGTTLSVHGLSEGKAIADQYRYLEHIDTQEILENGLRAESEGYDAFLIGNIFEPAMTAPQVCQS
jgi:allantoin racemase